MTSIRRAQPDDAEQLTDLHLDCRDDAYTGLVPQPVIDARRAERAQRITGWSTYVVRVPTWVAQDETGLVGFACSAPTDHDHPDCGAHAGLPALELRSLYARARVWGRGVGHALLSSAIGEGPAWLWVLEGNERSIGFYQRHGFVLDGTAQKAVEGVDLRMVRP